MGDTAQERVEDVDRAIALLREDVKLTRSWSSPARQSAVRTLMEELHRLRARQREGEREVDAQELLTRVYEGDRCALGDLSIYIRDLRRALLDLWRDAEGCPHCGNRESVEEAFRLLRQHTEPPAEPDLDELTPRCPVCEETMHDCECNPYMDTGGDDGDYANMTPGEAFDEGFAAGYAEAEQEVDT